MDDTTLGVAMIGEKRRALIDANKDNVVLESGVVRMRGDERVKPGRYVRLIRGTTFDEGEAAGLAADHYAYQVTHEYSFSGFLTTFQFDRGTGFVERVKRERGVNSPYLSELSLGGAYDGR
jgi:ribosomal protein L27